MLIPFLLPLLLSAQDSLSGQLPKRDLGVDAFLAAHPEYDGRTIRVAVLDTGIDPGHPFLQTTPDGRRKIVDWYDATSDGRLSTPVQTKADSQGRVIGLSGRVLDLGNYNLEGRVYSLGRVDAEFLPGSLADRIRGDRHQAWQDGRRSWQEARTRFEADGGAAQDASLRELETTRSWASFRDGGPCFDVVVFESEDGWRVVVDVDEDGDIGEEIALRSFRESGDWAVLGDEANLNFCIEVQSPELTMFYFDSNGHGTHVAGIIGAWEGPEGRLNGIAPGVEFVAIKIGDGKYGGATSGFSIAKALDYAVESGCTIANMSFGGPSFFADGQEPDAWVIEEARKRGLITVTSAGNEGPTLTTVGAPATAEAAFSIGAAVWPDTQRSNYSSLAPSGPVMFDFSSRGPLPNGGIGVDFAAPGAALSSLPSWLGTKGENFNGTSMAAPQAAGCIALLQCAAGVEGLPAGPDRIHRALRLGAQRLQGHELVDHGHGAISMLPSLEALRILSKSAHRDQEFEVVVNNPFGKGSGIYLRNPLRHRANQVSISVTPVFADKASNAEKSDFLRTFRVESPSTWVLSPEAVYTSAHGHSFKVRVDATELEPGLHSTAIYLWNAEGSSEQGADVVIPVTVVVPHEVDPTQATDWELEFPLEPGHLKRNFIKVPAGAHTAMIRLKHEGDTQNEYR
ncbi:MAG: S8 family serine peptidase, partial [Planctomycetes bacterium]|nr:S8 family serine peptidase [Planctomycetota bacterium]